MSCTWNTPEDTICSLKGVQDYVYKHFNSFEKSG